jgi:ATP synthase protein I
LRPAGAPDKPAAPLTPHFSGEKFVSENRPDADKQGSELSDTAKMMQAANPYFSAVWKMVGGAIFGVVGGYLLDRWLGTKPWILIGLSAVGISVGFYGFIRDMLRLGKK